MYIRLSMQEYKPKGRRPCQRLETKRNEDLNWQREFVHVALLLHNKVGKLAGFSILENAQLDFPGGR